MKFRIYRYDPDTDKEPRMQDYSIPAEQITPGMMLLEALHLIKAQDSTLAYRRSCQEGVCGSDGMNINGRNGLACITPLDSLSEPIAVRPFPGQAVIRDLVVDMDNFFNQYRAVGPYLTTKTPEPEVERYQSPEDRDKLDGLYECILCGCCSTFCPSFWWNPEKFLGPAALLQAWRFLADSRDETTDERLDALEKGPFKVYRCRSIMNCTEVCPKGLNPNKAIGHIRQLLTKRSV
jgi:succinate dehydrogenase / fumarate reductase, iron-sulfur subunit